MGNPFSEMKDYAWLTEPRVLEVRESHLSSKNVYHGNVAASDIRHFKHDV